MNGKMSKISFFTSLLLLVFAGVALLFLTFGDKRAEDLSKIRSFEECARSGDSVIMESYPRQCRLSDGRTFVDYIGNELEKMDLIRIDNPRPNQVISSPLIVSGEARGYWFFEASFPVRLYDANGNEIALAIAQAQGDWMTEDFVPYEAVLEFTTPSTSTGVLILEKDNPSGLSENEDDLFVPVKF
ncbi:MAG: Gmad2 immunoglobulin-like domain-containing protein [Candidatus Spechtbacterales bacterium]